MKNLDEKITRLGVLCKKGQNQGLTREENREFKKLEDGISDAMIQDEKLFDAHIQEFKEALLPLE